MKIHSLNPPSLAGHAQLYKALMHGRSELSRVQREMIAVVVSALNHCEY
jgi:alkylhydroperoxidase family enzyme